MSYQRIKLRHLNALLAVAEHGSLVNASKAMAVTQPAVSKALAELEEIVGQRLLERTRKGVELTTAGRVFLRYAGSSVRTLREGLDSIAQERGADAPVIVIGALPNVAATILPPAVQRFLNDVPNARVRVRTGSNAYLVGLLRQGDLDIVIGRLSEPADMQGLSFEHLYPEPVVFAVRPGHPLLGAQRSGKRLPRARGRATSPGEYVDTSEADLPEKASDSTASMTKTAHAGSLRIGMLRAYRMVLPDSGTQLREAADKFFLASGLGVPDFSIETIDVSFGRSFVLQTDAVWCAPVGVVENDIARGTLVQLPLSTASSAGSVGISLRSDRLPSEALQRLLAEVRLSAKERAPAVEGATWELPQ